MSATRLVRIIGFVFVVLGFGSAYLRTQLDIDTILTAWMGAAQPWAGIAMGVVGIVLVVIAMVSAGKKKAAQ